jgi:hypothetical protein
MQASRQRTIVIRFRTFPYVKEILQSLAAADGVTMSAWLEQQVIKTQEARISGPAKTESS